MGFKLNNNHEICILKFNCPKGFQWINRKSMFRAEVSIKLSQWPMLLKHSCRITSPKFSRETDLHFLDASNTTQESVSEDTVTSSICDIQFICQVVLRLKWLHPGRFIYFITVGLAWSRFLWQTKSVTYVTTIDVSASHIFTWRVKKPIITESLAISRESARVHVWRNVSSQNWRLNIVH